MRRLSLASCLLVLAACSPADKMDDTAPPFTVTAEGPIALEKVLYRIDPPAGPADDVFAALVGIARPESLDAFIRDHASREPWSNGPFRIDADGIDGGAYIEFLEGWIEAYNVELDVMRLVKWKKILVSDDPARYYRTWFAPRHAASVGQIKGAALWLIDTRTRMVVYFLQKL
jgi:hypothetical protein